MRLGKQQPEDPVQAMYRHEFEREAEAYRRAGLPPPTYGPREQLPPDPNPKPLKQFYAEILAEDEAAKAELLAAAPRHETITGGLLDAKL